MLTPPKIPTRAMKRARLAVSAIFLIHGMLLANWLSRIPAVQHKLGISVSALGVALLGASFGGLVAMSGISRAIARYGSARVTRWTSFGLCAALALPALAWNTVSLMLLLMVTGAFAGSMDVSMNTQAVDVEREYRRPVMVSFHALFSLGGMAGAGMGGIAAQLGIRPEAHLPAAGLVLGIATLFAARHLLTVDKEAVSSALPPRRLLRPLAGLALVAFCILLGEGAVADWSTVYLTSFSGPGLAASGYAVFSLLMATGRLLGDRLRARFGPVAMVRTGSALAALGLGGALLAGGMIPALIGFACAGAGWASIFPIACGAAGHKTGSQPQAGVAAVTATGFFAFLVGPPLIGFLAQAWTLRGALGVIVVLSALTALLARVVEVPVGESVEVSLP